MRFDLGRFSRVEHGDYHQYLGTDHPIQYKRKYSFSPYVSVTPAYRRILMDIREMDRFLDDIHLNADDYITAMKDTYVPNIRTSLDGHGSDVSFDGFMDTYRALNGREVEAVGGPEQEIYNSMCAFAYFIDKGDDWCADDIVSLHRMLTNGVDRDIESGALRSERFVVCDDGGSPLRLCCPPEYVRSELESLTGWLNSSPYDPIATGMIFVAEFSCIMPFKHGNNRVTHNMFQLILHGLGLNNIGLCRYDDLIDADRGTYEGLLDYARSQEDYYPLCLYMAETIHESYRLALMGLGHKDRLDGGDGYMCLIARCARYIDDEFTVSEACGWVPDVREQTVRTKLNALVDLGILDRKGNTRNTRYRYKDVLKHLRDGYNLF